jgi:hypothetical protein
MSVSDALEDLQKRVANYERVYEPLDEGPIREQVSDIKLINLASKCVCNQIHGTLMHSILPHVHPRATSSYLPDTRVGASDEPQLAGAVPLIAPLPASSSCADMAAAKVDGSAPFTNQPAATREPVVITYSQSEAASLDERGETRFHPFLARAGRGSSHLAQARLTQLEQDRLEVRCREGV